MTSSKSDSMYCKIVLLKPKGYSHRSSDLFFFFLFVCLIVINMLNLLEYRFVRRILVGKQRVVC